MTEPALVVRARRLRAARGVVVARDVALAAGPGDVVAAAAVTAIAVVPVLTWLAVLAHRACGRAFAAHAGGRARAHLATDLGLVPFAVLLVPATPMTPLLRLSTHPATLQTPVGGPAAWLLLPGLALMAAAAFLATRLT